jgi:glutathione S-transferase
MLRTKTRHWRLLARAQPQPVRTCHVVLSVGSTVASLLARAGFRLTVDGAATATTNGDDLRGGFGFRLRFWFVAIVFGFRGFRFVISLYGFGRVFPIVVGETKDLRVQWALEEMGLQYRVHPLDHTGGEMQTAEYTKISPFQRVPALVDEGFAVAESGAILFYLAEKYRKLIPSDFLGRTHVQQWCFSAFSTVEYSMQELLIIDKFGSGDSKRREQMVAAAKRELVTLERELSDRDWIAGSEFTIADIAIVCVLRMIRTTDLLDGFPHVKSYYARASARPAWQRTLKSYADRLKVSVAEIA